ncbi:methyltransferase domain-containing protein [Alteriqipengyuania sp. 357]
MRALQQHDDAPRFIQEAMVEEIVDRLAFMRFEPQTALILGDAHRALDTHLPDSTITHAAPDTIDEEAPVPDGSYDLIASLGLLDTINDLPGALVHMRRALTPNGIAIAILHAAGSLDPLRRAMLAAEPDRPAPRMHPMVDARGASAVLSRAGFVRHVVDTPLPITARYGSLDRLVADLRAQGMGNVLRQSGPPLGRGALERARAAFLDHADPDGKVPVTFEMVALTGWA